MPNSIKQNKKTTQHALSLNQIQIMLFSSLVADAVIVYYNTGVSFIAHEKIWAAIINCVIVLLFSFVFLNKISYKQNSIIFCITAFLAFAFNAAITLLDAENFARYANNLQISGLLVVAIMLILCVYAIKCAEHTVYRACGVFITIFCLFTFILILANAQKMHITNLSHAWQAQNGALVALFMSFRFPVALLLFMVMPSEKKVDIKKNIFPSIAVFCAMQIFFAITSELIFASQIEEYSQPIFTMAKTASFSVFKHFEPLYFFVFMFALIIKACVFFIGAYFAIKPIIKKLNKNEQVALVSFLITAFLVAISFISIYIIGIFTSILCILALIIFKVNFKDKKFK